MDFKGDRIMDYQVWYLVSDSDRYVSLYKENLVKFESHLRLDQDPETFRSILQHCGIGHFSTVWLISLEKLTGS